VATRDEAADALLDEIVRVLALQIDATNPYVPASSRAAVVLKLAEAYAWVVEPGQAHGGSSGQGSD
jgi:hypothetical protein